MQSKSALITELPRISPTATLMVPSMLSASYFVVPICLIHLLVCISLMGWWPSLLVGLHNSPFLLWPNAAVFCICVLSPLLSSPQSQVDVLTAAVSVSIIVDLAWSACSVMHAGVHGPCKSLRGGPACVASGAGALGGLVVLTCLKALGLCALTLARRTASWPFGIDDEAAALIYLKRPMRKAKDGEANTVNLFPVLLAPTRPDAATPGPSPLSFRAPRPPPRPLQEPPQQQCTLSYGALEEECDITSHGSDMLVPFQDHEYDGDECHSRMCC